MSLSRPPKTVTPFRRVAILFAGGPAPAANAVISTAANSFLRNEIEVVGVLNGYSRLLDYRDDRPLQLGRDYLMLDQQVLRRTRNSQGILIGTARANPGRGVSHPDHLDDPVKVAPLRTVYDALRSIGVDAVISIGGDDTLKTANKLKLFQDRLPHDKPRMPVVHLPKTIDNDYMGIDFTFGYFTAVDTLATELRNLLADAEACRTYFLVETMGRSAGWLAYGVAMAGEASVVISVEDITGKYCGTEEVVDPTSGQKTTRPDHERRRSGQSPGGHDGHPRAERRERIRRDGPGRRPGRIPAHELSARRGPRRTRPYRRLAIESLPALLETGRRPIYGGDRQPAQDHRAANRLRGPLRQPHAFDVMLGSQLGVGAYRALVEERLNGVMVSVSGQLDLNYVPFEKLVDPETLVTMVRYVRPNSDFHRLARFLETYVNE